MLDKKIIICSTIRNVEKDLENFFQKIDEITLNFQEYFIILVQSNSNDNTIVEANKYLSSRRGTLINKDLDINLYRTERLEACRNEYLNYIRNYKILSNYDYLLVMDADSMNNSLKFKSLEKSINSEINWNAIFANQRFIYYDIWTLRIKNYIEFDCFQKIKKESIDKKNLKNIFYNFFTYFFYLNKHFKERFIKVDSAFGGLGIYKLKKILEFTYDSKMGAQCEHVGINEKLNKKYGNLYIDKKLVNSSGLSKHSINGLLCGKSNYFARRFLSIIKKTVR